MSTPIPDISPLPTEVQPYVDTLHYLSVKWGYINFMDVDMDDDSPFVGVPVLKEEEDRGTLVDGINTMGKMDCSVWNDGTLEKEIRVNIDDAPFYFENERDLRQFFHHMWQLAHEYDRLMTEKSGTFYGVRGGNVKVDGMKVHKKDEDVALIEFKLDKVEQFEDLDVSTKMDNNDGKLYVYFHQGNTKTIVRLFGFDYWHRFNVEFDRLDEKVRIVLTSGEF